MLDKKDEALEIRTSSYHSSVYVVTRVNNKKFSIYLPLLKKNLIQFFAYTLSY